jgi:hypothetical protein
MSTHPSFLNRSHPPFAPLAPLRHWVDEIEIRDRRLAHIICRLIPPACPFERDITLWGHKFHIPAFCKLNPLYNEVIGLRFRALNYLSDVCGEDITPYIYP